jgi:hypothetical protein
MKVRLRLVENKGRNWTVTAFRLVCLAGIIGMSWTIWTKPAPNPRVKEDKEQALLRAEGKALAQRTPPNAQ